MPSSSAADEKPKKRAVRTRASTDVVKKRSGSRTTTKRAVRKRAVRKRESTKTEPRAVPAPAPSPTTPTERKAPTPIAAKRAKHNAKRKQMIVVASIFVVGVAASAAIGYTDDGQIDVNQQIAERNERIRSGQVSAQDVTNVVVPVQNTNANQLPNGGLVGLGTGGRSPAPAPEPQPATTTATSTDVTATTSAAIASSTEDSELEPAEPEDEQSEVAEGPDSVVDETIEEPVD